MDRSVPCGKVEGGFSRQREGYGVGRESQCDRGRRSGERRARRRAWSCALRPGPHPLPAQAGGDSGALFLDRVSAGGTEGPDPDSKKGSSRGRGREGAVTRGESGVSDVADGGAAVRRGTRGKDPRRPWAWRIPPWGGWPVPWPVRGLPTGAPGPPRGLLGCPQPQSC